MNHRIERDSLGEVQVPEQALYGAQTQRAIDNFGLGQRRMPQAFIRNLARIKSAAAFANLRCEALDADIAAAIQHAADSVAEGEWQDQFPLSVFQTGSGTSTNMNMNEVLARLASEALGKTVHPNDHVNCSQSSNDVIPSCIHLSALQGLGGALMPALSALTACVLERRCELLGVAKTGRTHLMDAMPLTLGQELGAW
ncbi:MAG: aspartate ammonia-lyase, partial [Halioglobus sp.]|nr:aspartate ammonia-lyase [Halioglobus sp.]